MSTRRREDDAKDVRIARLEEHVKLLRDTLQVLQGAYHDVLNLTSCVHDKVNSFDCIAGTCGTMKVIRRASERIAP